MSKKPKTEIRIFITNNGRFRVKIKESHVPYFYEVTIGGKSWNSGTGRHHEEVILKKCKKLLTKLNNQLYENIINAN
jgi:hypothetical protein